MDASGLQGRVGLGFCKLTQVGPPEDKVMPYAAGGPGWMEAAGRGAIPNKIICNLIHVLDGVLGQ